MGERQPLSLLWKILLSTSLALTVLFGLTGWIVQEQFLQNASAELRQEVQNSFQAYGSLWRARAERLAEVSLLLSRMPDVRAAFGTGDAATIRDTASEVWETLARDGGFFLVADPAGRVLASLGGKAESPVHVGREIALATRRFPQQSTGFLAEGGGLFQIVLTPVYVAANREPALLNVLVAGFPVNEAIAKELQKATGGSEFVFSARGRVMASSLGEQETTELGKTPAEAKNASEIRVAGREFSQFVTPLLDLQGTPSGQLRVLRSFDAAQKHLTDLRSRVVLLWALAMLVGLAFTFMLARHLLQPLRVLDAAAAEIGRGNYETRIAAGSNDEMGRLARTFNSMCASIRNAREDLIRHEQIATIGRLSTSIIHDLRNPLAAIYGGAEMLVDSKLSEEQVQRLSRNIYRSSRRVQDLLQELADVNHGRAQATESCRLQEIVAAGFEPLSAAAGAQNVAVEIQIPDDLEVSLARSPMERVFTNLIGNSLEAMPNGGAVHIRAENGGPSVVVTVEDSGPGVAQAIRGKLFQPFVTAGKKNGMGLGLALSRQIVLDHGGDLWLDGEYADGARFCVRLPT